ncbi:hypothetical protein K458DRAFT_303823, partial [Lentithecium fluviatile CBS 122367]
HLRGIPLPAFPRIFLDVVSICRALKIRYLWIDALCIVQDSTEDWEVESAKMAEVYSNSYLTISATSCADPRTSLFSDRWTTSSPPITHAAIASFAVQYRRHTFRLRPKLHLAHDRFSQLDNAALHAEDAPLMTRAWAYQERPLPSRTLHFLAEELVWECKADLRCECGLIDNPAHYVVDSEDTQETTNVFSSNDSRTWWFKSSLTTSRHPSALHLDLSNSWMDLVSKYSRLGLTRETDRLPALSDMAAEFNYTSLGNYVAGMWTSMLPRALLYEVIWDRMRPPRPQAYHLQAPTWSWASTPLSHGYAISYDRALNDFTGL